MSLGRTAGGIGRGGGHGNYEEVSNAIRIIRVLFVKSPAKRVKPDVFSDAFEIMIIADNVIVRRIKVSNRSACFGRRSGAQTVI